MKKLVFMLLLLKVAVVNAQQFAEYTISKVCTKKYDKDLEVFKDWSDWKEAGCYGARYYCNDCLGKRCDGFTDRTIQISPAAVKITYAPHYDKEKDSFVAEKPDVLKFVKDIPSDKYSFYKEIMGTDGGGKKYFGSIYANTTLQELLKGTFKGEIYYYYVYETEGKKGYVAYRIE